MACPPSHGQTTHVISPKSDVDELGDKRNLSTEGDMPPSDDWANVTVNVRQPRLPFSIESFTQAGHNVAASAAA